MIKYICDRCGRSINSDYYYKISINSCNKKTYSEFYYSQLVNNLCVGSSTASTNLNLASIKEDKIYCVDCKEKIEKFLEGDLE